MSEKSETERENVREKKRKKVQKESIKIDKLTEKKS